MMRKSHNIWLWTRMVIIGCGVLGCRATSTSHKCVDGASQSCSSSHACVGSTRAKSETADAATDVLADIPQQLALLDVAHSFQPTCYSDVEDTIGPGEQLAQMTSMCAPGFTRVELDENQVLLRRGDCVRIAAVSLSSAVMLHVQLLDDRQRAVGKWAGKTPLLFPENGPLCVDREGKYLLRTKEVADSKYNEQNEHNKFNEHNGNVMVQMWVSPSTRSTRARKVHDDHKANQIPESR